MNGVAVVNNPFTAVRPEVLFVYFRIEMLVVGVLIVAEVYRTVIIIGITKAVVVSQINPTQKNPYGVGILWKVVRRELMKVSDFEN